MSETIIHSPTYAAAQGQHCMSVVIEIGGRRQEVFFRSSVGPLCTDAGPFLISALVPAMREGVPLRVEGPVSPLLLERLDWTQDLVSSWLEGFRRIPIEAPLLPVSSVGMSRGVGCFFSGGVDSSYTLLKHRDRISHLIFVHGFDIDLGDVRLYESVASVVRRVAQELGKTLIEVQTNVRDLLLPYVKDWNIGVTTAAAAVAYLLSPLLRTVYRGGGAGYSELRPVYRFPLFGQACASAHVQIIDDGREATRHEKVEYLARDGMALRWLRVCYENRGGAYNCGRCAKCLDTMVSLLVAGALDKAVMFSPTIEPADVRRLVLGPHEHTRFRLLLPKLKTMGADPELIAAVQECIGPEQMEQSPDADVMTDLFLAKREIKQLRQDLKTITSSRSWRMTAPLRRAGSILRSVGRGIWQWLP